MMDHNKITKDKRFSNSSDLVNNSFSQQLVDCLPMGAMVVNSDARIVFVNDELAEILGYSKNELLNLDIDLLLPIAFQANHKHLMSQFFKQPRKRKMGVGQELYACRKDGIQIPIEIGLNPIQQEGQTLVLATLIDLTSHLRANKMFHRSIEDSPHGVLVVDSSGIIRLTNSSLCEYFGYTSDELLDQPLDMLLPQRYRAHHGDLRHSFHQNPTPRMKVRKI